MKVDHKLTGSTPHGVDQTKNSKISSKTGLEKTESNPFTSGPAGSSRVDVSDRAQMMQKAKELASRPDTVDEAKVARLQKLIDEGKYKTDSAAIADRLVDEQMSFPD